MFVAARPKDAAARNSRLPLGDLANGVKGQAGKDDNEEKVVLEERNIEQAQWGYLMDVMQTRV